MFNINNHQGNENQTHNETPPHTHQNGYDQKKTMETYTLPYVKWPVEICCMAQGTQTKALQQPRRGTWSGSWEGGSRGRRHVHPWLIHVDVWQEPTQYCKAITLRLKMKQQQQQILARI